MSSSLQQGQTTEATIGIKRAKNFDEDVALKFADVPSGVAVEPASPIIRHGDAEAQITLTGTSDASLGKFDIKATGHPAKGADASNELKLAIVKQ